MNNRLVIFDQAIIHKWIYVNYLHFTRHTYAVKETCYSMFFRR